MRRTTTNTAAALSFAGAAIHACGFLASDLALMKGIDGLGAWVPGAVPVRQDDGRSVQLRGGHVDCCWGPSLGGGDDGTGYGEADTAAMFSSPLVIQAMLDGIAGQLDPVGDLELTECGLHMVFDGAVA
jgi:hypothetical protein